MPLSFTGADTLLPVEYVLPVPSARVKSAVLLAGLRAPGKTTVVEASQPATTPSGCSNISGATDRDHRNARGRRDHHHRPDRVVARRGAGPRRSELGGVSRDCGGDPPGSDTSLDEFGLNPARAGVFVCLQEMGADIAFRNERDEGGEPVADLVVKGGALKGIRVPAERAASMIDEYPILAVAAACAGHHRLARAWASCGSRNRPAGRHRDRPAGLRRHRLDHG